MIFAAKRQAFLGLCFVLPLFTYGIGTALWQPLLLSSSPLAWGQMWLGSLLISINSILVITIGYLVFPWLHSHSPLSAKVYFLIRIVEAILLLIGLGCWLYAVVYLPAVDRIPLLSTQTMLYQVAMLLLGLGSLVFCWGLFHYTSLSKIWPSWASVGYLLLTIGCIIELLGWPYGVAFSIIGGLFELCFGSYLLLASYKQAPAIIP